MSLAENLKLYYGFGDSVLASVEIRGEEHYRRALEKGRGIFFITGHCGNWELMALAFGAKHGNVSVVARRQNNPVLNGIVEKMRGRYGNAIIYKEGAFRRIVSRLKENHIVGILMDQAVVPEEGFVMDFLGRPARVMRMPALMARKTGVPMLPVFIARKPEGGHTLTVYPEIEPSDAEDSAEALLRDTEALSKTVERYIVENPTEWYWVHRRWKHV